MKKDLRTKKSLKAALNTLGVKHMVYLTGDVRAGEHLLAVKPPGRSQVLPQWQLEQGMQASQAAYKQEQRVPVSDRQQRARFFQTQTQGSEAARKRPPRGKGKARGRGRGRGSADDDD